MRSFRVLVNKWAFDVLYRPLLGRDWALLDPAVRKFHQVDGPRHGSGVFSIKHGTTLLARLLIAAASLPSAGVDVRVMLDVIPCKEGESWRRRFGERVFLTRQRMGQANLLMEEFGPIRIRYRLSVVDGALLYRQVAASLCLGGAGRPLPSWLVPHVSAREWSEGDGPWVRVRVSVLHRFLGSIFEYEGRIQMECESL